MLLLVLQLVLCVAGATVNTTGHQAFIGTVENSSLVIVSHNRQVLVDGVNFHDVVRELDDVRTELGETRRALSELEGTCGLVLEGLRFDGIYAMGGDGAPSARVATNEHYFLGSAQRLRGWRGRTSMPAPRYGPAVICSGINVWVFGGYNNAFLTRVDLYDASSNTWTTGLPAMPTARHMPLSALVDGWVYVVGGRAATHDRYSLADARWESGLAQIPVHPTRENSAAVSHNGSIFVFGGQVDNGPYLDSVFQYFPPPLDSWRQRSSMLQPQSCWGAVVSLNGKEYILVTAGAASNGNRIGQLDQYDPSTDEWTNLGRMRTVRAGAGVLGVGSHLYVVGGTTTPSSFTNVVERYDLSTKLWELLPSMPTARVDLGVCLIA